MFLFLVICTFLAIAAGFAYFLVKRDRGEKEPIGALWIAFGMGIIGVVVAGLVEVNLPDPLNPTIALAILFWVSMAIGAIEELIKLLPLMGFLYRKRYFNEHTDGIIYFALAGLGFGLPENVLYTLQYGAKTGLARLALTPLFHAATTGIIGYAVARTKVGHIAKSRLVAVVATVIVAHGLYDFGLFSRLPLLMVMSVLITAALTVMLFYLFMRAQNLDQKLGLSAVGHNAFCRSCGHPNPKHNLYCSNCGQRA